MVSALHDDLVDHAGQQLLELLQYLLRRGEVGGEPPQLCEEVVGREGRGEVAFRLGPAEFGLQGHNLPLEVGAVLGYAGMLRGYRPT